MPIPAAQRFVAKANSDIESRSYLIARKQQIQIVLRAKAWRGHETGGMRKALERNELEARGLQCAADLTIYQLHPPPSFRVVHQVLVETVRKPGG